MRPGVARHYSYALALIILTLSYAGRCAGVTGLMDEGEKRLAAGNWGGKHVRMEVADEGALLDFDCAKGSIPSPVTLDTGGRFSVRGQFAREGFGPRVEGEASKQVPALYVGEVKGESMTLTVTLVETREEVGTYTLTRGSGGRLWKCQ